MKKMNLANMKHENFSWVNETKLSSVNKIKHSLVTHTKTAYNLQRAEHADLNRLLWCGVATSPRGLRRERSRHKANSLMHPHTIEESGIIKRGLFSGIIMTPLLRFDAQSTRRARGEMPMRSYRNYWSHTNTAWACDIALVLNTFEFNL